MMMLRFCVMAAMLFLSDSTLIRSSPLCFSSSSLSRMNSLSNRGRSGTEFFTQYSALPNALRGGGQRSPPLRASPGSSMTSSAGKAPSQKFFAFEGIIGAGVSAPMRKDIHQMGPMLIFMVAGAGKSTLLAELEAGGVKVVPEPLERYEPCDSTRAMLRSFLPLCQLSPAV